jgi:hypothetical protein
MGNIIEDSYVAMQNKKSIPDFSAAIAVFEKRKADYDAWYMAHDRVSIAMMCERESLIANCDWAINALNSEAEWRMQGLV